MSKFPSESIKIKPLPVFIIYRRLEEVALEILAQLSKVTLADLLTNIINESLGITVKKQWEEQLQQGRLHELHYVEVNKNDTNPELLHQLIQEWMPVYEQLSFRRLLLTITTKPSHIP